MKQKLFKGVCTALVTPFLRDEINYPLLDQLIQRQIDAKIEAVVISGTTGESAVLSDLEKLRMIQRAKAYSANRCKIIAGTGSNSTTHAIALSQAAEQAGADGLLIVSPYYNKTTPAGLVKHFSMIAEAVTIPIIIYNVPSRTGLDIPVSVCQELSQIPNIIGIKEANPDVKKALQIAKDCPNDFSVWSGNDETTVPMISIGGCGVISVVSNLFPEIVQAMALAALDGDFDTASALQIKLLPLIQVLFSQVNPIPVKAAMSLLGLDCGECRMPLMPPDKTLLEALKPALSAVQNI